MDCKDHSDENFCQNVEYHGKSYYTHIPPQEGTNQRTKVEVGINIHSLSKIDQLEMQFTASIAVIIKWRDSRLFFSDLLDGKTKIDDTSMIWMPPLFLSNSYHSEQVLENKFLLVEVEKLKEGKLNDQKELRQKLIYEGIENDLVMSTKLETEFYCSLDLRDYPFDYQHCTIGNRKLVF